ncbi:LysE family translocator [Agrobacterium sp. a22-2]|uniref:LysE family translocator n=1 Tax=Agrobacterium sp. a22-2 TaxID=2283840 RepID=UPI0014456B31|nr:LysE family translocator [Agrobacterium sp. a22-2]NKN39003.1 LysE family translocator [Agrobacterium sp. a22-2]
MSTYSAFFVFWFLASIPLGPNAINSIRYGATLDGNKWILAPLGTTFAAVVFCAIVLMGLGLFVAQRPYLQLTIQTVGATYLLYLGVKVLYDLRVNSRRSGLQFNRDSLSDYPFRDGFLISMTNPKPVILYTSVLSSYLDLSDLSSAHNAVILSITIGTVFGVYMTYGLLGKVASSVFRNERIFVYFQIAAGLSFILLALGIFVELAHKVL